MTRYVAFLRGVNLGSSNKVAMPALRAMAERLGYADVRTYINSGNLLLTSDRTAAEVTAEVAGGITTDFGLRIDVAVRSAEQVRAILAGNPYPDGDPKLVTVAMLLAEPSAAARQRLLDLADVPVTFAGTEVWVHYLHGQGGNPLAAQFSRIIGVSSTVRNVRTMTAVADLLRATPP